MPQTAYVVIGSNCFTGSHIVDALLDDPQARVLGVSRSPEYKPVFLPYKRRPDCCRFEFRQVDIVRHFDALIALIDEMKPQVVINVAALSEVALSNERPCEYFETNTLAVVKLCEHLRRRPCVKRYVHISSAEILGSCAEPVTESERFDPSTPYAVSKAAADMYLNVLIRNFAFPAIMIRTTNVYGPHQQLYKIIPRTIISLRHGTTVDLHGGGKAMKSFVHIRDVTRGIMAAIDCGQPGTYHFSAASDLTVADVVRIICRVLGHDFDRATRVVEERLGQDARYWLDCSKAARELGWAPEVRLEDGLKEVISWIEENWTAIMNEPHEYIHTAVTPPFGQDACHPSRCART